MHLFQKTPAIRTVAAGEKAGDTKGKEEPVLQTAGWLFKILVRELGLIKINVKKGLKFNWPKISYAGE